MEYTEQQKEIITRGVEGGCVKAFAGTGKTSTLLALCKAHPDKKFLYLVFNKSVKEESRNKFPPNTRVETVHSAASRVAGRVYKQNGWEIKKLRPSDIQDYTNGDWLLGHSVLKAVRMFCITSDPEITADHVQPMVTVTSGARKPNKGMTKNIVRVARKVWDDIKNVRDTPHQMLEHDFYLKKAQLEGTLKSMLERYDIVLVDEAQDLNPVMLDPLKEIKTLAVGDPHQGIYAWRGAKNALDYFEGRQFLLSQSFRFGKSVADLATLLLQRFSGEKDIVKGWGDNTILSNPLEEKPLDDVQRMLISRTNTYLIFMAADDIKNNIPIYFMGGLRAELASAAYGCWGIMKNIPRYANMHPVTKDLMGDSKWLGEPPCIYKLQEYVKKFEDNEIRFGIDLCFKADVPVLLRKIEEMQNKPDAERNAKKLYTTAHRSKGLEHDHIVLCDDFVTFCHAHKTSAYPLIESGEQEVNLLYVALTRGKKSVIMNDELLKFIEAEAEMQEIEGEAEGAGNNFLKSGVEKPSDVGMPEKEDKRGEQLSLKF